MPAGLGLEAVPESFENYEGINPRSRSLGCLLCCRWIGNGHSYLIRRQKRTIVESNGQI